MGGVLAFVMGSKVLGPASVSVGFAAITLVLYPLTFDLWISG